MSRCNTVLLESHLKTLRLPTFLKEYAKAAKQSGERGDSHDVFLEQLAELEVNQRRFQGVDPPAEASGLPGRKDLSELRLRRRAGPEQEASARPVHLPVHRREGVGHFASARRAWGKVTSRPHLAAKRAAAGMV